jgi:hypothetical protein
MQLKFLYCVRRRRQPETKLVVIERIKCSEKALENQQEQRRFHLHPMPSDRRGPACDETPIDLFNHRLIDFAALHRNNGMEFYCQSRLLASHGAGRDYSQVKLL